MRALAPVLPEGVSAGVGNLKVVAYSGFRGGQHWVYMDIQEGSYGGRHGKDGLDAVDTLYANTRNNPIEDIESHFPLRVTQYELLEDRAGAGRWRGGLGSVREIEFLDDAGCSLEGDGSSGRRPACSAAATGRPARSCSNRGTATERELPSKFPYRKAAAGDRLCLMSPCGGGYGDPRERDPDAIRADIDDGYVSRESARDLYDEGAHMKKRLPVLVAALVVAAAAVVAGALAGSSDTAGAQANLDTYRAVPTFKAPGPGVRREGEGRRQDDLRHPGLEPDPVRLDDREQHQARRRPGRRQGDDLAEPGPAVAVGAGDERGDRAEGERDRPARRQRSGRPAAADQGGEGEGHPDDRRAPLRREAAVGAERRRRREHPVQRRRPADRRPGDRRHEGQGERARRDDQPGQVDGADGGRDQVGVRASTARAASSSSRT